MKTRAATIETLLDQLKGAGILTTRKMFGEYCLYLDGITVALVCRDQLFVKPTIPGRLLDLASDEVSPFPGIRPYLLIDLDPLDDPAQREAVCELLRVTAEALSTAKPSPRRSKGRKSGDSRTDDPTTSAD